MRWWCGVGVCSDFAWRAWEALATVEWTQVPLMSGFWLNGKSLHVVCGCVLTHNPVECTHGIDVLIGRYSLLPQLTAHPVSICSLSWPAWFSAHLAYTYSLLVTHSRSSWAPTQCLDMLTIRHCLSQLRSQPALTAFHTVFTHHSWVLTHPITTVECSLIPSEMWGTF